MGHRFSFQPARSLFLAATLMVAGAALAVVSAHAGTLSPWLVNPANGQRYLLLDSRTWSASEAEAVALGGHLATVRNAAEEDWIFDTFGRYGGQRRLLWIGLTDQEVEGKFVWTSGEPVMFDGWAPNEPNSIAGENFAAIYYPGHSAQNRWNDWGNRTSDPIGLPFNGVVELHSGAVLQTLVPLGSEWRYLDDGSNQGAAWRAINFNDANWSSGLAQLGYGDGDERTVVRFGLDPENKFVTTYFRRAFVVNDPASIARLHVRLLRDDGAVVYLNGVEVYRSNLPSGAVGYRTLASAAASADDETTILHTRAVSAGLLRDGANVLAVDVHQSISNSTDLSFDLELNALNDTPPAISLCSPLDGDLFAAPSTLLLQANAADDDRVAAVRFYADGELLGVATNAPFLVYWSNAPAGQFTLMATATDSAGASAASAPVRVNLQPGLVFRGATWRFLATGVEPAPAWRAPEFNDASWSIGPAQLGYGDDDEATLVDFGPDPNNKYLTTYFRRRFVADSPAVFTNLLLRLLRDDGAVVYLNGDEVLRSNLPTNGPVLYSTLALAGITGAGESTWVEAILSTASLRIGTNLLAVEMHQVTNDSTDLSFDLELIGLPVSNWPRLEISRAGSGVRLRWPAAAAAYALESAAAPGSEAGWLPANVPLATNSLHIQSIIPRDGARRFFRLRR